MISKNTIKRLNSLSQKKYRNKEKLFLVEGDKMVMELMDSSYEIETLYLTEEFVASFAKIGKVPENVVIVNHAELKKISQLQTPQNSLAVCRIPVPLEIPDKLNENLSIYLDGIRDPGNFGTIIRICDWFGIRDLFCSADSVDLYNPKVIQASMGSFTRVNIYESEFAVVRELAKKSGTAIYGAFMDGTNVYTENLSGNSLLVMGNEGNGISETVEHLIDRKISIPSFSNERNQAESLNVSVATAILCSEFKRR